MLVQTITISFSSFAADTIRIHTGETGREILFAPDMEISGEYSADFIVIKPDDTFVIDAATITDGKINVVIPEQAGAVAGAGHYILKIYDSGSVCIYSASGGFMVDDHLLTDSMIESVAEAYGYTFPQDFAILDDAETSDQTTWSSSKIAEEISEASPDPSTFIDDNEVLYDKTWSSEKIAYELGNIPYFHVYTTTEQPVGRWIDGEMLFEKTFLFTGSFYGSNNIGNIGVSNVGILIIRECTGHTADGTYRNISFAHPDSTNNVGLFIKTNGDIELRCGSGVSGIYAYDEIYFTIRYTKTA